MAECKSTDALDKTTGETGCDTVKLKLGRDAPALQTRCWQNTNTSIPDMKVKRAGFDGETYNLAGRQEMCTRSGQQTQISAGRGKDQTETGAAGRGMEAGSGEGILAGT